MNTQSLKHFRDVLYEDGVHNTPASASLRLYAVPAILWTIKILTLE
uniref:Uncharacterized protein n=1 Tax=Anguilla anguilla TaxID=7936 RepID=A0A0E9XQ72_ANGAN